ncbi:MAG: ABC transporter substrate-binding protein [Amphritea sp.]
MSKKNHPYVSDLKEQLNEGQIERRDFLRTATLLGMSATAAYAFAGPISAIAAETPAPAAMPKGGTLRIGMRVMEVTNPHAYSWLYDANVGRQVTEYLTITGQDNITRPYLAESWEVSDDLKTWTFKLRDVKWHSGRALTAEDVAWNIDHALDPATGSSIIGVMSYMLDTYDTGTKDEEGKAVMSTRLWSDKAIEVVDSRTVRLNLKEPQVAVPEHLYSFMLPILDPAEGGKFGPGSNGTGPFELVEHQVGSKSILRARKDYWGNGPYIDELQFIDLGDDASATIAALASKQIDGVYEVGAEQLLVVEKLPHLNIYSALTSDTAVARMQVDRPEFKDPRVRKAVKLAIDTQKCLEIAHQGLGAPGEHHHVCSVHPDYYKLPFMGRDVEAAKKLLAEAGYPDGIDLEITTKPDPAWEAAAVQVMVEQWKDAGIRVKINMLPSAQFWDVWLKVPFGFTHWNHRPLGFMILGLAYRSGVPWNESHYSNPEFDALLTKAEGTLDVEERRKILGRIEEIFQEDGPIVQPIWRSIATAYDKRVLGFNLHPTLFIFGNELALKS